jgi:di/tricarboxylate transporter
VEPRKLPAVNPVAIPAIRPIITSRAPILMTADILLVFAILLVTIGLFMLDRLRLDLIALLALLALLLTDILTPQEALAGFSDPIVVMIAGLFVVGAAIFETGIADAAGRRLSQIAGISLTRLIIMVMLTTACLSAFLSSTGTVAVMLPVVISLARRARISPAKLLIPLAFASLLGGMLTLIGTPPNIVVSNQLLAQGWQPFNFFDYTPVGLVMLFVGIVFMVLVGQRFLPDRMAGPEAEQGILAQGALVDSYQLRPRLFELRVLKNSPASGFTLAELCVRSRYSINVIMIETQGQARYHNKIAEPHSLLRENDRFIVKGEKEAVESFAAQNKMSVAHISDSPLNHLQFVEILIPPRSRLLNKSLRDMKFRENYGAVVLAEKRSGQIISTHTSTEPLCIGDTLLVAGAPRELNELKAKTSDFIVVSETSELKDKELSKKAPFVLAILFAMMTLMTFGWVANVTAVMLAAIAVIVVGAMTMESLYKSINWESVILIAAILPMATALEKTGALPLIVDALLAGAGRSGSYVMLLLLFLLTSLLSQVISNTATSVLVAPVAFQLAIGLGTSPYPFLMTVAVAASTAFATPVASPVNALVLNPGNYRFMDFFKIGVLLQVLILLASLIVIPVFFPF